MAHSAERQFLVMVSGIAGAWARRTGGESQVAKSSSYDGGNPNPEVLTGNRDYTDLVVTRPYNPARDADVERQMRRVVGSFRTTVSETPLDGDLIVIGQPKVWHGVLLKVMGPELNAESATNARLELTFGVSAVS
jgi:hypothetical protein